MVGLVPTPTALFTAQDPRETGGELKDFGAFVLGVPVALRTLSLEQTGVGPNSLPETIGGGLSTAVDGTAELVGDSVAAATSGDESSLLVLGVLGLVVVWILGRLFDVNLG